MKITVFKRHKAKQFEYRPLYYDARKEELEQIQQQYTNPEEAQKTEAIRERITRRWEIHRNHKGKTKNTNHRLVLYLIIIGFITYVVFFTELF